ncbi:hypothetical protein MM26B8_01600 [Mycoplasmopsis meleagridis]|uniref:SGNH hydrolase-type esterase domain-containing protein n=1 Tax=Mycoplasmopsis meleagridis ATCC 25294 TaxID=1264554 RepID=A0A0F5H1B7_9BACT|nr:SGNH/GDSL hydrolase family protein [Mycoplasmopsis meleagridis]KKB26945.1 hypothetical protein MMELEA_03960 [Mycoplasmopsis meleagridis ATCC 25294]OAD18534.1 hypothetical protein MM26B8_01600 [Mycoplasmopsis meleagridis]VEU77597.1 Predicted membrane protein [Mycoplasmopsis meleagridis]
MKFKIGKKTIIAIASASVSTIVLAISLSFIRTKEQTIDRGDNLNDNPRKDDSKIPTINDLKTIDDKTNNFTNSTNNMDYSSNNNSNIFPNFLFDDTTPTNLSKTSITKNEQVKYLAIGDSVSADWDARLPKNFPGQMNEKGIIEGVSYPVFLASFIQKAEKNKLASFVNLSKTSATLEDFYILLGNNFSVLTELQRQNLINIFGEQYIDYSKKLVDEIKKANLMTISLGANDIINAFINQFSEISFFDIFNQIISNKLNYGQIVQLFNTSFKSIFDHLENNQTKLIKKIKELNPKLNINFIGYSAPMPFITKLLDNYLNSLSIPIQVSQIIIDLLNKKIEQVANQNNTNYINIYNNSYWDKNIKLLSPNLFDIHPSLYAYKRMAMDIFAKLTLNTSDLEKIKHDGFDWDAAYYLSDRRSYVRQIEFNTDNTLKLNWNLFTSNQDEFLKGPDKYIDNVSSLFSQENYYKRVLNDKIFTNLIVNKLFFSAIKSSYFKELDPELKLNTFLTKDNNRNLNILSNWFINNHIFSSIFKKVSEKFVNTDWDNDGEAGAKEYKLEYLIESFKETITNEESIVSNLNSFFKLDFLVNDIQRTELKDIVLNIFNNLINKMLKNNIFTNAVNIFYDKTIAQYIDKNDLSQLITILLSNKNLKEILNKSLTPIFNAFPEFATAKNFDDFINIFLDNPNVRNGLEESAKLLFKDALNNDEFKQILTRLINNVIKINRLNKNINELQLKNLIHELINVFADVNKNTNLVPTLLHIVLDNIDSDTFRNFNSSLFISQIVTSISEFFSEENGKNNLLAIVKTLFSHNIEKYKNEFKTLLFNVLNSNSFNFKQSIISLLSYALPTKNRQEYNDLNNSLNEIFNSHYFNDLISNLIDFIFSANKEEIKNSQSLYQVIGILSKNVANSKLYSALVKLIENILSNPNVKNSVDTTLLNVNKIVHDILENGLLKDAILFVFNNYSFKQIINNFFNKALANSSVEQKDIKFSQIIKDWLNDNANNQVLEKYIKSFVLDIANNKNLINLLGDNLYRYLKNNSNLVNDIEKNQFILLLNNLISAGKDFINNSEIIDILFHSLVNTIKNNGLSFNGAIFSEEFNKLLDPSKIDSLVTELYKAIIKNKVFNGNKEIFKILLTNIFNENKLFNFKDIIKANVLKLIGNDNSKKDINNLIDNVVNSKKVESLIINFLDKIFSKNYAEIKNVKNIYAILKVAFKNIASSSLYNDFINIIEVVLKDDSVANLINNLLLSKLPSSISLKITKNQLHNLVLIILKDPNFVNIANDFVNSTVLETNSFEQLKNITSLIEEWLKKENTKNNIGNNFSTLILNVLQNNDFKLIVHEILYSLISQYDNLLKGIDKNKFNLLIDNLINIAINYEKQFKFISKVSNIVLTELSKGINKFNFNNILNALKNEFNKTEIEKMVVNAFKISIRNNLFKNNKDFLITIFYNVVNSKYFEPINELISNLLVKIVGDDKEKNAISSLIKQTYNSNEVNKFIQSLVEKISQITDEQAQKVKSYNDIFKLLLDNFSSSNIYSSALNLINYVLNNKEVERLTKKALDNNLGKLSAYISYDFFKKLISFSVNNQNIKSLVDNFINNSLLKENVNINAILTNINMLFKAWLSNDNNINFISEKLESYILELLKQKDLKEEVSKIIYLFLKDNSNIVKDIDQNSFISLINKLFDGTSDIISNTQFLKNLVKTLLFKIKNDGLSSLTSLKDTFSQIFKLDSNMENFALNIYKAVIKNNIYKEHSSVVKKLVINIINEDKLFSLNGLLSKAFSSLFKISENDTDLNEAVNSLLNERELNNLIDVFVNKLFYLDYSKIKEVSNFFDLLKLSLTDIIKSGIYDKFVSYLISAFEDNKIKKFVENKLFVKIPKNNRNLFKYSDIKEIVVFILNNQHFKQVVNAFFNNVLLSIKSFSDLTNIDKLFVNWFNNNSNNNYTVNELVSFVQDILSNNNFKDQIARMIYSILSSYNGMTNDLSFQEFSQLFSNLTGLINQFSIKYGILNKILIAFTEQFKEGITKFSVFNLVTSLRNQFNDKTLEATMIEIFKSLVSDKYLEENRKTIKKIVINFLTSDISKNIRLNIGEKINKLTKNSLTKEQFSDYLVNIFKSNSFAELIDAIFSTFVDLKPKLNTINNTLDLTKLVLSDFTNSKIYNAFIKFVSTAFNKNQIISLLPINVKNIIEPLLSKVTNDKISALVNEIFKDKNIKEIINHFIQNFLLKKINVFEDLGRLKELFKEYISNQKNNSFISTKIISWIKSVFVNPNLKPLVSQLLLGIFDQYTEIKGNLKDSEIAKLLDNIFISINQIDDSTNMLNDFIVEIMNEIKNNFDNFSIKKVISKFKEKHFSNAKIENTIVKIFKALINNNKIKENKNTIISLLQNFAKFTLNSGDSAIINTIWKSINGEWKETFNQITSLEELKVLTKNVIDSNAFYKLFNDVITNLFDNPSLYSKVNTIADILKIYSSDKSRNNQLSKDIEDLITTIIKVPEFKNIFVGVVNYVMKKYQIDINFSNNEKLVNDLYNELPQILSKLNFINPVMNGIINNADKLLKSSNIIFDLVNTAIKSFDITQYRLVKILLSTNTLRKNKAIVKDSLLKLSRGITSKPELIKLLINDFNLKGILTTLNIGDQETNDFIIALLQSNYLQEILDIFIREIIDNNEVYAKFNTWTEAIKNFFNSSSTNKLKDLLKRWLREIFINKSKPSEVIGELIAQLLKQKNFDITGRDINVFKAFSIDLIRAIANSKILDNVVDAVFNSLKNIGSYKGKDYITHLQYEAIRGALKFIKQGNKISLQKIFDNLSVIKGIVDQISPRNFTDFINVIFSKSPANFKEGVYGFLFNPYGNSSNSSSQNVNGEANPFGEGVDISIGAALHLVGNGLTNILKSVISPVIKQYFEDLVRLPRINSYAELKQKSEGYQALWRIFSSLLLLARQSNIPILVYWTFHKTTVEGIIHDKWMQAISSFKQPYRSQLLKKYGNTKTGRFNYGWPVGLNYDYSINSKFWEGTQTIDGNPGDSNNFSQWYYTRDSVLTYIYYGTIRWHGQPLYDKRFNKNKTFSQVLMEDLKRGYMPNEYSNKYDRSKYGDYRGT